MATSELMKKKRRRYVRFFREQLVDQQALSTYAERMVALGLFSKKTGIGDIKSFIMQIAAKSYGHRNYHTWVKRFW